MLIDENIYNKLVDDIGKENAPVIVGSFIEELDSYIFEMQDLTDFHSIASLLHQLKSTARMLGATNLADMAIAIELEAKEQNAELFKTVPDLLSQMSLVKNEFLLKI